MDNNPNFIKWFGKSKIVDATGKPLVVYHGGVSGIESFDPIYIGTSSDGGYFGRGFSFTSSIQVANNYQVKAMMV